jgi:ADP-ribose pyrophosphatase YjhB (NUDIX family)
MPIPRAVAVVVDAHRALVIKRYVRKPSASDCVMCEYAGRHDAECLGHHYAVLPGGHVEPDETPETTAVRELTEETTLTARIDRLLWTGEHNGRPASYFLMTDVTGPPLLSGPEAKAHRPGNTFKLLWAAADDFDGLGLYPADVKAPLAALLQRTA